MIKILTYNIHKGFDRFNRDFVLHKIKEQLHDAEVDIVLLQEIQGRHFHHENRISTWPEVSQFEFLADSIWPHYAYGKNAIYRKGSAAIDDVSLTPRSMAKIRKETSKTVKSINLELTLEDCSDCAVIGTALCFDTSSVTA